MGVSTTTNTVIDSGDGTTVSFAFAFYFFRKADLYVYLFDTVALTITLQVLATDYTISGTPNAQGLYPSGGNVVFAAAPASTLKVVISRFPIETQVFALLQNGIISSTALVQQLDYLTLLTQSLQDQINRCLQLPAGFAPVFNPDLPVALPANYLFGVNSTGDGVVATLGVAGPTGPAGPPGAAGAAGLAVSPLSSTGTLAVGSPVNQKYVPCDATGGAFNVNLPVANLAAVGQVFQIKKVDSSGNAVTVLPNGSDVIISTSSLASLTLDYQGKSYTLACRAAGFWDVL